MTKDEAEVLAAKLAGEVNALGRGVWHPVVVKDREHNENSYRYLAAASQGVPSVHVYRQDGSVFCRVRDPRLCKDVEFGGCGELTEVLPMLLDRVVGKLVDIEQSSTAALKTMGASVSTPELPRWLEPVGYVGHVSSAYATDLDRALMKRWNIWAMFGADTIQINLDCVGDESFDALSPALRAVLRMGVDRGLHYVLLDPDALQVDDIPTNPTVTLTLRRSEETESAGLTKELTRWLGDVRGAGHCGGSLYWELNAGPTRKNVEAALRLICRCSGPGSCTHAMVQVGCNRVRDLDLSSLGTAVAEAGRINNVLYGTGKDEPLP